MKLWFAKMVGERIWFASVCVVLISSSTGSSVIVEKGHPTTIQCSFSNSVENITWQLLHGSDRINISTCSVMSSECNDTTPSVYQGESTSSGTEVVFSLSVAGARLNDTDFACLANSGQTVNVSILVYDLPVVGNLQRLCPHGRGLHNNVFLINATAFCECSLEYVGVPKSFPRWFAQDGSIVGRDFLLDGVSDLNVTFDYTDPEQTFECRADNPLNLTVSPFVYTPMFTDDYRVVQIGTSVNLTCSFPDNVTSITWQSLTGNKAVNMSTCNVVGNSCTNPMPEFYKWNISRSGSQTTTSMDILSVRPNETLFSCLANNGRKSNITQLDVFSQPSKPQCTHEIHDSAIGYSCTTDKVFGQLKAVLHRRNEVDFYEFEYRPNISYSNPSLQGLKSANLSFELLMTYATPHLTVYVEVIPRLSSGSLLDSAVLSDDLFANLSEPVVFLNSTRCPFGPGVRGIDIRIGKVASCTCDILSAGFPKGHAGWYSKAGNELHAEYNQIDGSATLNITFDPKEKNPSYECRPMSNLGGNKTSVIFLPTFYSSAQPMVITGLHVSVIILGIIVSGVIPCMD